jgi:hypothetical protein
MKTNISDMIKMENGKVNVLHALQSNWFGTQWVANGSTYDGITWSETNETSKPAEAEIDAEVIRLQAEYDAQAYARNRATAYDSVGDQLDQLMKDMRDGTTTHQTACEAVKAKFPKP